MPYSILKQVYILTGTFIHATAVCAVHVYNVTYVQNLV